MCVLYRTRSNVIFIRYDCISTTIILINSTWHRRRTTQWCYVSNRHSLQDQPNITLNTTRSSLYVQRLDDAIPKWKHIKAHSIDFRTRFHNSDHRIARRRAHPYYNDDIRTPLRNPRKRHRNSSRSFRELYQTAITSSLSSIGKGTWWASKKACTFASASRWAASVSWSSSKRLGVIENTFRCWSAVRYLQ